jgi:aquaporin Z
MKKYIAEFIGTFTLVFFGCGSAVLANKVVVGGNTLGGVGLLGISFAFGFALIAMAYGIGPISGCHINPAVSLGAYTAGRMTGKDLGNYIIAQILGGIVGAGVLALIVTGRLEAYDLAASGLGQNGWGDGYLGEYGILSAIVFEFVATLLFIIVILGSTQNGAPTQIAGLAIGITLVVIHIVGIPVTGVSVNPARSLGPALFAGGQAISQLWLFLIVPSLAGVLAGLLFRNKILELE